MLAVSDDRGFEHGAGIPAAYGEATLPDGVDHARASFEVRLFLNHPDAGPDTPTDDEHGYAGSFFVFGHAGCAGDEGHCDVPAGPRRPFDLRPEHQLTPVTERVIITEALRRMTGPVTTLWVSAVPVVTKRTPTICPRR